MWHKLLAATKLSFEIPRFSFRNAKIASIDNAFFTTNRYREENPLQRITR